MDDAAALAARLGKPIFLSEFGCIARANAYDQGIELASLYGMGWTLWELMVLTRESEPGTVPSPCLVSFGLSLTRLSCHRRTAATSTASCAPPTLGFLGDEQLLGAPTLFA